MSAVARGERVAEALLDDLVREAALEQRARRGASSPPSASAPLPLPLPPAATPLASPRSPLGGAPLAAAPLASGVPMGVATFGLSPAPRSPAAGLPPLSSSRPLVSGGGSAAAAAAARLAAPPPQPVATAVGAVPLLEALLEAQRRAQPEGAPLLVAGLSQEALSEAMAALVGEAAAEGEEGEAGSEGDAMRPTRAWSRLAHRLFNELAAQVRTLTPTLTPTPTPTPPPPLTLTLTLTQGPDLPVFGAPTVLPPSLVRRRQEWALREAVARLSPPEHAARASGSVPLDEARQKRPLTLPLTLPLPLTLTLP